MSRTFRFIIILIIMAAIAVPFGLAYASWAYTPYDQFIAESDVIVIGEVRGLVKRKIKTEHITYDVYEVDAKYYLKGENQGGTIYVGTPNNRTSLHFTLDQWGSQVMLILDGMNDDFIPNSPQGVIGVSYDRALYNEQESITGEELLSVVSLTDPKLKDEEKDLISDYIGTLSNVIIDNSLTEGNDVKVVTLGYVLIEIFKNINLGLTILIACAIIVIIAIFAACWHFSNRVINIRVLDADEITKVDKEDGTSCLDWYDKLPKERYLIDSPYGYNLYAAYIPYQGKTKGTIIFSHGVTVSHVTSIKYMRLFYDNGYNCLVYDHRRHGNSDGKFTTYGYYEKYDLQAVVDWLEEAKGFDGTLGIHGESMGSAITLLYAAMEDKADFYIVDCPYTTIWDQLLHRLKAEYSLPVSFLLHPVSWIIYLRAGFKLKDVDCLKAVKSIKKPVLFIHGTEDDYVPTAMGKALYDAKPEPKELYLVPGARHAKALATDPEKYKKIVLDFADKSINNIKL